MVPAVFCLLSGCSRSTTYRVVSYGGSFLVDSVTVGFLRAEHLVEKTPSAWDVDEFSDHKQDLVIYSVQQRKILSTVRLSNLYIQGQAAVLFSDPWVFYKTTTENTYQAAALYNIRTGERKEIPGPLDYVILGLSPDGKYAFYRNRDYKPNTSVLNIETMEIIGQIPIGSVFYVARNAEFYLYTESENPQFSNRPRWIIKGYFDSNRIDTLLTVPDTIMFRSGMTDFHNLTIFSTTSQYNLYFPRFCSMDSLIAGTISILLSNDSIPLVCDISLKSGVYTYNTRSNVYIKNLYNTYPDTQFINISEEQ
jgi:hypothetical protein